MPRKRDLSPSIWRSAQFLALPDDSARLTFIAMISLADDLGVGRIADLRRHTAIEAPEEHVRSVVGARLAHAYAHRDGLDDLQLYLLPKWCRHQLVNRPSRSNLPLPATWKALVPTDFHGRYEVRAKEAGIAVATEPATDRAARGALTEPSVSPHGVLTEPQVAPSPSPSPIQKKTSSSSSTHGGPCAESDIQAEPGEADLVAAIRACATPFLAGDPRVTARWARTQLRASVAGATPAEVARADAWCQSNPARTARRRSATRFLDHWFKRAQERAVASGHVGGPAVGCAASPGDTTEHRARTAQALRCAPDELVFENGTYRRKEAP